MEDLDRKLRDAIDRKDVEACKALIFAGANVNDRFSHRETPLFRAALVESAEIARVLIDAGAKAGVVNIYGTSPLHTARGEDMCRLLLQNGANPNVASKVGIVRPLHSAAANGWWPKVIVLIAAGANVNARDAEGRTAFHHALSRAGGNEFNANLVCQELIKAGADVEASDDKGNRPLALAAGMGYRQVYRLLVEAGAMEHIINRACQSALHLALLHGQTDTAQMLIGNRYSELAPDVNYNTPLHYAARHPEPDFVRKLISVGANVNAQNRLLEAATPLHRAAESNHAEICRILVESGADPAIMPESPDDTYLTPLQAAVKAGAVDAARYFLTECGEDIAQKTVAGRTLVQLAGKSDGMKALLRAVKTELAVQVAVEHGDAPASRPAPRSSSAASPL